MHLLRKVGAILEGFWKILDSELELVNVFIFYFFFEEVHNGDKIFIMSVFLCAFSNQINTK